MPVSQISLVWPGFLILLVMIPLLAAAYVWFLRRRRKYAVRYSSLALIRPALVRPSRRRHIPPALFLLSLASLVVSLARPTAIFNSRKNISTIILVIDVSASMMNDDIFPSRLKAAESAALSFVQLQEAHTQIGVVVFSNNADLILPPTTDHDRLKEAILSLTLGTDTAMGSGIDTALAAISKNEQVGKENAAPDTPTTRPKGEYAPGTIILLTDGYSTVGPPPLQAAAQAARQGVRIYTIGIGAQQQSFAQPDRSQNAQQPQIPVTGGPGGFTLGVDGYTLKRIAVMTGGSYSAPESAGELEKVFKGLSPYMIVKSDPQDISAAFIGLGALLACAAVVLSQLWHPLVN